MDPAVMPKLVAREVESIQRTGGAKLIAAGIGAVLRLLLEVAPA
jgi:hypothetical protein